MARKSKTQVETVEVVAVAEVDVADENRKAIYSVAEGTKLTETPGDWDVTKHRTIRKRCFATKADWCDHRAVVHLRLAEVLKTRAQELRLNGDKDKARRRAAKLVASLAALRAEFGDEIVQ